MTIDFKKLKTQSGEATLERLIADIDKMDEAPVNNDREGYWQPTVDKAGNGYAVIRFLPRPPNEDVEYVRLWEHGFQGPTKQWYIEKSLTTLGKPDPCSEYNTKLWNSGIESDKKIVSAQKRKLVYISNIYVVEDSAAPENNGKVFRYRYGKKIFDKLKEAMKPQFPGDPKINPFDLWKGANFKLKIRKVDGYRNYDKCEFDAPGPLLDDDEKLEQIWRSEYSLKEEIAPEKFKSYAELQARLALVLGIDGGSTGPREAPPRTKEVHAPDLPASTPPFAVDDDDGDTDIDNYFEKLVNKR